MAAVFWVQSICKRSTVAFRRQLYPGWAVSLTASYGTNQSLTVPFVDSASSINLTSAGVSRGAQRGEEPRFPDGLRARFSRAVWITWLQPATPTRCEPEPIFCNVVVSVGQTTRNVGMEEELQESSAPLEFTRDQGHCPPPAVAISGAVFLRLAAGVGSELGDPFDLSLGNAHSGRAAFGAGEIRCLEHR